LTKKIDCPVCKGSGKRYDTDLMEETDEPCTACKGSKKLEVDPKELHAINQPKSLDRVNGWTPEDDDYLRKARARGVRYKDIAKHLDRTRDAVQARIIKLKRTKKWNRK
jgi:hypothetical protein